MKIEITFKGKDDPVRKLKNAKICAEELNKVQCSWHGQCAQVEVVLDKENKLSWSINNACCENFENELAKAINDVTPKL